MYRSTEIIHIFYHFNIPEYITKYILELERIKSFQISLYDSIHLSKEIKLAKSKRLFYDDFNDIFLNEIKNINGDFNLLQKHKLTIWNIKNHNYNVAKYLNSIRY